MRRRLSGLLVAGAVLVGCAANNEGSVPDESSEPTTTATNLATSLTTVDGDVSGSESDVDQLQDKPTLDHIEELRQVIEIDYYPPAQNPCFVDSIVDTLGVARLAEIGVTVETPDYLSQNYRLTADEYKAIDAYRASTCDLAEQWASFWIHNPELHDCIVRQMSPEELEELVREDLFDGVA